ncbi:MAG: phage portal protein [Schlesneria sp.]
MHNSTMAANQRRRMAAENRAAKRRPRNATGNPESQSVPLDPDYWEELGWMGVRSDAGVRMNHQQAIGHPPIWRAINLLARGVAKLPSNVYRLSDDGNDSSIDKAHPAHYLLTKKPNANIRAYVWKCSMMYHALLRGNGYSGIVRRGADPIGLILLDPTKTEPFWVGDQLWYKTEAGTQKRKLPAADVFHLRGLSFDGIVGHDILHIMCNAMGMGPAGRKWMSKLLSRGSTAGGLLQLPRELSPESRRKRQEEFDKYQSGLDNAFKTLALEDGAKWIRTMITPQEAMIFEVLGADAKLVSNIFGIPAHKLGDDSKSSYNSLEQENKSYLDESLDPWCIEFETEASDKLLTEEQNRSGTHEVYIDRTALEIGDLKSQAEAFTSLANNGLVYPDEARARMNMAPMPHGEGKKLRLPVNISVDGKIAGAESPSAAPPTEPPSKVPADPNQPLKNAARDLVADRLGRLDKIVADQLPKVTSKGEAAVADFWRNHRDRIADALKPILPVLAIANGLEAWPVSAEELGASTEALNDFKSQISK